MGNASLLDSINFAPVASFANTQTPILLQEFRACAAKLPEAEQRESVTAFATSEKGRALLAHIYLHSPYLSQVIQRHMPFFAFLCRYGVEASLNYIRKNFEITLGLTSDIDNLMRQLRTAKAQCAMVTAFADLGGIWNLEEVTAFLSETAEKSLALAVDYLLLDAQKRGELLHIAPEKPSENSGLIVLGMGKLGAYELNYSSDIDIIVLYDASKVRYEGRQSAQQCFSRITRDLVRIMQERTQDGYVFRTDIRLRPDPASTPPAMSVNAALTYYETTGQNWERAALIKARPVAGDIEASEAFLKELTPFVWRRNLDFAAIADIHSIKRQIDHRTGGKLTVAGHNLKLGIGGIREIEFFVQVQQLIWGGRNPHLRHRGTCEMLKRLAEAEIITPEAAQQMQENYRFLRMLEHRVQMQRDQQSHSLPSETRALREFADFAGFASYEDFEATLLGHLRNVKQNYRKLYGAEQSLGHGGNLVFTGVDPDPGTVETLQRMGFREAERICGLVANWHRGHRRATRNKRARELLTEVTPDLLKALASTANPDAAFHKFDEFLGKLPAGVQIFSLFAANPQLLQLIAMIMGSAPRLAETLSRNTYLLDAVLTGAFYEPLPDKGALEKELASALAAREAFEDYINIIARFKNEKDFQAGIQLMSGIAGSDQVGIFLSDLAEAILIQVLHRVWEEFSSTYGEIPGSKLAIIALGKLGSRELTFSSDLDLSFVYHTENPDALSNGERSFTASVYFNRLCQRLLGVLTALSREGRLYEVDTRLRPLGGDGPLAVSLEGYEKYFTESAWTFEYMALTRARAIQDSGDLSADLDPIIFRSLTQRRDAEKIRHDVTTMRQKVEQEFGTHNPWNVKYVRGGLMDMDFIAQYLQLVHGHEHPSILAAGTPEAYTRLQSAGLLEADTAHTLHHAYGLMSLLLHLLRLCSDGTLDEATAPEGLKTLLAKQLKFPDFLTLQSALIKMQGEVYNLYRHIFAFEGA